MCQALRETSVAVIGAGSVALQLLDGFACGGVSEIWPLDLSVDSDG